MQCKCNDSLLATLTTAMTLAYCFPRLRDEPVQTRLCGLETSRVYVFDNTPQLVQATQLAEAM